MLMSCCAAVAATASAGCLSGWHCSAQLCARRAMRRPQPQNVDDDAVHQHVDLVGDSIVVTAVAVVVALIARAGDDQWRARAVSELAATRASSNGAARQKEPCTPHEIHGLCTCGLFGSSQSVFVGCLYILYNNQLQLQLHIGPQWSRAD